MFLKLDTNNDGVLTLDELEAGMHEIAQIFQQSEPDVRAMLMSADVNGDGKIDYTEFIAAAFQKDMLLSEGHQSCQHCLHTRRQRHEEYPKRHYFS